MQLAFHEWTLSEWTGDRIMWKSSFSFRCSNNWITRPSIHCTMWVCAVRACIDIIFCYIHQTFWNKNIHSGSMQHKLCDSIKYTIAASSQCNNMNDFHFKQPNDSLRKRNRMEIVECIALLNCNCFMFNLLNHRMLRTLYRTQC